MTAIVKLKVPAELQAKLDAWSSQVKVDALEAMQVQLPTRIIALNDKLEEMAKGQSHLLSRAHYFDAEPLAIDTNVYPASTATSVKPEADAAEQGAPPPKKRKAPAANSSGGSTTTGTATTNPAPASNGPADAAEPAPKGSASDDAHVFTGRVRTCDYLVKAHDELRDEWHRLIQLMDTIKMYINLQFPKIEDGDTFGQSVQEEALQEVVRSQESAYSMLATAYTYHSSRGELAAKLVRYPGVEDHRLALVEYDRRAFYRLTMQFTDLRNMYSIVFDILAKNMEKISKPKSGNQMGSYG